MNSPGFFILALVSSIILAPQFAFSQQSCTLLEGVDALENELLDSPDVMELAVIADDMMARVAEADHDALREAYRQEDEAEIANLLGFTSAELDSLAEELEKHSSNVVEAFPELEPLMPRDPVAIGLSDVEMIDRAISMATTADGTIPQAGNGGVDCAWVPYTASLTLCTATGPIYYWACAAVAMCHWCSGGYVHQMCAIP